MTPYYLNPPSPSPQVEGNQGQDHLLFTPTSQTCFSSYPNYFNTKQEQGDHDPDQQQQPQQNHKHEADMRFSTSGSDEHYLVPISHPTMEDHHYNSCIKPSSICKRDDRHGDPCDTAPVKWMSSKMRLMRKMTNSDQTVTNKLIRDAQTCSNDPRLQSSDSDKGNNSTNNEIRVCADCNTTKTPLWRSGPRGPKSLCNACGIRQRKARRALAAAVTAASGGLVPSNPSINSKVPKEKRSDSDYTTQYKKRCKMAGPRTKKKLRFDDFTISLSKNSAFHRVFPQDEKDAAILLMALSCGLVRG